MNRKVVVGVLCCVMLAGVVVYREIRGQPVTYGPVLHTRLEVEQLADPRWERLLGGDRPRPPGFFRRLPTRPYLRPFHKRSQLRRLFRQATLGARLGGEYRTGAEVARLFRIGQGPARTCRDVQVPFVGTVPFRVGGDRYAKGLAVWYGDCPEGGSGPHTDIWYARLAQDRWVPVWPVEIPVREPAAPPQPPGPWRVRELQACTESVVKALLVVADRWEHWCRQLPEPVRPTATTGLADRPCRDRHCSGAVLTTARPIPAEWQAGLRAEGFVVTGRRVEFVGPTGDTVDRRVAWCRPPVTWGVLSTIRSIWRCRLRQAGFDEPVVGTWEIAGVWAAGCTSRWEPKARLRLGDGQTRYGLFGLPESVLRWFPGRTKADLHRPVWNTDMAVQMLLFQLDRGYVQRLTDLWPCAALPAPEWIPDGV